MVSDNIVVLLAVEIRTQEFRILVAAHPFRHFIYPVFKLIKKE